MNETRIPNDIERNNDGGTEQKSRQEEMVQHIGMTQEMQKLKVQMGESDNERRIDRQN